MVLYINLSEQAMKSALFFSLFRWKKKSNKSGSDVGRFVGAWFCLHTLIAYRKSFVHIMSSILCISTHIHTLFIFCFPLLILLFSITVFIFLFYSIWIFQLCICECKCTTMITRERDRDKKPISRLWFECFVLIDIVFTCNLMHDILHVNRNFYLILI